MSRTISIGGFDGSSLDPKIWLFSSFNSLTFRYCDEQRRLPPP